MVKDSSYSSQPVAIPTPFNKNPLKVEQSLLLWAMVVLLAITAFIGLDLATHTAFSLLAIPFGVAGSLWSYRRRHLSTHPVTYLVSVLAIVLILTCLGSAFWGQTIEKARNFLGSDRDLVLPLAASFLLVGVQVAGMWSLCYRRGLTGSVAISAMLIVIAVLIGNHLGFLLVLALFVGLLVPTLMLFYRSKLNLKPIGLSIAPRPRQLTERYVPWQYLAKIAAASVVLGCFLSLFAPHLRLPDVAWDLPGIDQMVKSLPIQTDPDLANPGISKAAEMEGTGGSLAGSFGAEGQGSAPRKNTGNGIEGQSGEAESQQPDEAEYGDEELARQAIRNILATADRPLTTTAERKAHLQKYLREHIQSPECESNNASCFNNSRRESRQVGLAYLRPAQVPWQSYYLAQWSLLEQLTAPCPVDQPDCYRYRVFRASKPESTQTGSRLLRSIGGMDSTKDSLDNQSDSQGSGAVRDKNNRVSTQSGVKTPRTALRDPHPPAPSPRAGEGEPERKADQAKLRPGDSSGKSADKKSLDRRSKLSAINAEQLTNLLRVVAVILLLVAAVVWYLWLQSRQEKISRQKERKFNQLPLIDRIYRLMLKELRASGSVKRGSETEWEFALAKTQRIHASELQYPGLLGKLITEISGDYVAWRYGKKIPNDNSLNHKFERFCELHSEFCANRPASQRL